ncbi:MAG TPA: signal recognition particle protein [Candidatus Aphodomorpha intestinavium]|uniref:Signal recognition particle protein n=1 Tax=Candidatus Aphodomorpha intestinavium TaxID=2840672 RepID=A0A9D1N397_9FIRM|nr:signal recognition particle protein [Candidatus Aphodomorpha intestinavium]
MAFEGISARLQSVFKKLSGRGKLSEKDVRDAMREIRLALLEADVNFLVAKDFVKTVTERAVGAEVLESLTPGQQVVKIVNEELTRLMGGGSARLEFGSAKPAVFLLAGLQGAGKTTLCGKLAVLLKKQYGKTPMLAACDVYRPAAIEQLKVVGAQAGVPVFERGQADPVETAQLAVEKARHDFCDVLIVDTAGRLHIDADMMDELGRIRSAVNPSEVLLVVDAMTGQDAVNAAKAFNDAVGLSGVVLTKLDGDTRGGAALSVRAVTGRPIKLAGVGEKLGDLETFHPDRMASRILGMGDVLSLIEKAQSAFDEKKAAEQLNKLRTDAFTLDDFLDQLDQLKSMGSMQDILAMLPGVNAGQLGNVQVDEKAMARTRAIICSMTRRERANPDILNASRRRRIARGSGTSVQEVNRLMNQFAASRKLMKQMAGGRFRRGRRGGFPFGL